MTYYEDQTSNREIVAQYVQKVRKYDPSFVEPGVKTGESYVATEAPEVKTGGCYVATCVYGSYNCPEVWTLRRYRDYDLAETWYGRLFIRQYYAISPGIVKYFGETEWFRTFWKHKLDRMVGELKEKGFEDTPYVDRNW